MTETCVWCRGSGAVDETLNFLLARMRADQLHDWRWIGRSSSAMVLAAMTGEEPTARPFDGWDLGRCLVTRAVAPQSLHERMDAMLARWIADMESDRHPPYHGVAAAREMAEKETPAVRAWLEHFTGEPARA